MELLARLLADIVAHRCTFSLLSMLLSVKRKRRIVLQGEKWLEPNWLSTRLFIGQVILKIGLKLESFISKNEGVLFHKTLYAKLKNHRLSQQFFRCRLSCTLAKFWATLK